MSDREIMTRRNLPHWYVPGAAHFVTYRVAGTIPANVLADMRSRRDGRRESPTPEKLSAVQFRQDIHEQFFTELDGYLDTQCGIDWLARYDVAAIIRNNLYHHHESKYHLLAYCIMPNHVHVLFQPIDIVVEQLPACFPRSKLCQMRFRTVTVRLHKSCTA